MLRDAMTMKKKRKRAEKRAFTNRRLSENDMYSSEYVPGFSSIPLVWERRSGELKNLGASARLTIFTPTTDCLSSSRRGFLKVLYAAGLPCQLSSPRTVHLCQQCPELHPSSQSMRIQKKMSHQLSRRVPREGSS